uniref:Uncharacterized protein n=1 Tax=viral metagenome TaxID=1070528 RepID=A0A6C0J8S4_9ZZZZ
MKSLFTICVGHIQDKNIAWFIALKTNSFTHKRVKGRIINQYSPEELRFILEEDDTKIENYKCSIRASSDDGVDILLYTKKLKIYIEKRRRTSIYAIFRSSTHGTIYIIDVMFYNTFHKTSLDKICGIDVVLGYFPHTISEYILQGFSNKNKDIVCLFKKLKNTSVHTSRKNIRTTLR